MAYNLGIDIGIASIGFAAVDLEAQKILLSGAHIFEAAENPKTGASLATPRRTARGQRRVINRRAKRKKAIRQLFRDHGFDHVETIDQPLTQTRGQFYPEQFGPESSKQDKNATISVWDFRNDALKRQLTDAEFARVLFHIAKRRGFQSNRKGAEANDIEGRKALSGAKELQDAMAREGHATIGAHLAAKDKKRNGDGTYENFVERNLLRHEVRKIFESQRAFGFEKATQELEAQFVEIAFFQRPLQSSAHLIGFCSLEPAERRAPKFSHTAELFVLWSKLNNLRIKDQSGGERSLTQAEKETLAAKAHTLKSLSYVQIRKQLELTDQERFNISYRKVKDTDTSWEAIRETTEKKDFISLSGYHAIKDALAIPSEIDWRAWLSSNRDTMDETARLLSVLEDAAQIENELGKLPLTHAQITRLSEINHFKKTVDLSLKALRTIEPHMQQGLTYDKACLAAGYDHSQKINQGLDELPPFEDIRNPVVNRALAQSRKIINAVLRHADLRNHGKPQTIIIELARDVGKNFQDRKAIEQEQKKNEEYRDAAKKHVGEILGIQPENVSGEDILKYRLWKEQDAFCPYSGVYISPEMLRDSLATQIDHIIPYSRSWNDSYMNKILCLTSENQNKGNDTPREYFSRTGLDIDILVAYASRLPRKKAENLLLENFDEEKAAEWKSRAMNDTRYIARALKNHLEQSLDLGKGNRVQTRNGALTAHLRGAWGFPDKDRRNDRHHALDAIVLACSTQSMVQALTNWNKYEARRKNPAARVYPPKPWENFRDDAKAVIESVFVSRMPVRRITGAAHDDTIRSIKKLPNGEKQILQRVKLKELKAAKLENLVDKERNLVLYRLLKERLGAYRDDAKKAFAEPIFMPVKDSNTTKAPRIKSVRLVTSEKSGIEINHGFASNGDMVRVDVFKQDGKFHLVPIYVYHFTKTTLPNRAIARSKSEDQWTEVDDRSFLFSLHKNDYVNLIDKKGKYEGYYVCCDRYDASIDIKAHDSDSNFGANGQKGFGTKALKDIQKYSVDFFGNKTRIIKETRLGLANDSDSEPS
jgi:CRISPR-associated endonuclease Csn1